MAMSLLLITILLFLLIYNYINIQKNNWINVFGLMIILLTFFPIEAIGIITGVAYDTPGCVNLSILCYDVLIVTILSILLQKKMNGKVSKNVIFNFFLLTISVIVIRLHVNGLDFLSNKMLDNYIVPILLSILAIGYLKYDDIQKIIKIFVFCILVNAFVACIEYFIGKSLFFHNYYINTITWYQGMYMSTKYGLMFRSSAFLGHPLVNGTYYLSAIIFLLYENEKKYIKKYILLAILLFATFTTNSRAAILVTIIAIVYYLIKEKKYFLLFLVVFISVLCIFSIDFTELYNSIFARDLSGGSMNVRYTALKTFFEFPIKDIILGIGFNKSNLYLKEYGFTGNLEISYLIMILDVGLLTFLLWISMICALIGRKKINKMNPIARCLKSNLIMLLGIFFTYNSIGDPGTLNYLLFFIIAIYHIAKYKCEREDNNECIVAYRKNVSKI